MGAHGSWGAGSQLLVGWPQAWDSCCPHQEDYCEELLGWGQSCKLAEELCALDMRLADMQQEQTNKNRSTGTRRKLPPPAKSLQLPLLEELIFDKGSKEIQ